MLTRRELLELGATAELIAMLSFARSARAAGLVGATPPHLRRASWTPLTGATVAVAGVTLRLASVEDLPRLAGRDDAFRLELAGRSGALRSGTHRFLHPSLGSFDLFISPVEAVVGGVQHYEVVIDRSVADRDRFQTSPRSGPGGRRRAVS